MQRMTPLGRLIVILLLLGAVFVGLKYSGLLDKLGAKKPETTDVKDTTKANNTPETPKTQENNTPASSFSYTPPLPVNGKLKGVVELGASGFNSFIVSIDEQKNWKLEKAEFGASLAIENMATDADVQAQLKKYIAGLLDYGVSGSNIHFVVSSGAVKADNTVKIIRVLKGMKYFVNIVTPEQEGTLALECVLPKEYENTGFVTDIGSGNTKISWNENGKTTALETYGAKYFQNNTDDKKVYDEVSAKAKQVPGSHTKTCFIIGGSPFKLAKEVRKGKERFTVLKAPADYTPKDAKDKAGVNIYKAVADATGCQQFVFDWDANFTIGFLLTLP